MRTDGMDAESVDWDRILRAIEGSRNSLAGWLRRMEDYDDEAMKRALKAAYDRPDPRIRQLEVYRAMTTRLEAELAVDDLQPR